MLSAALLIGAITRVSVALGPTGALALVKLVAPPAAIAAVSGATAYRLIPGVNVTSHYLLGLCWCALVLGIIATDLCLFAVTLEGIPFLAFMLRE